MTRLHDLFADITDRIRATARVETVYGEPQTHHGRTVIPVARVAYGFGAGGGAGTREGPTSRPLAVPMSDLSPSGIGEA